MKQIDFLKESLRDIRTIGTVTRSSKALCKAMIKPVDFDQARLIVELGVGRIINFLSKPFGYF